MLAFVVLKQSQVMTVASDILTVTLVLLLIFKVFSDLNRRNNEVHEYRLDLLTRVGKLTKFDSENGLQWKWRYDEMNKIGYFMLLAYHWVPLEDSHIYKDLTFLNPNIHLKYDS